MRYLRQHILAIDPGTTECGTTSKKRCSRCGSTLPLDMFYKNPLTQDRRGSWCKLCEKARDRTDYTAKYRATDAYRTAFAKYRSTGKAKATSDAYVKRAKAVSRVKFAAREKVSAAVKSGVLIRPDGCEACGSSGMIHAHHHDYSKPLEVRWLCPTCHTRLHRNAK